MLTLDTPHYVALLLALPLLVFVWGAFVGFAKNRLTFFILASIFPAVIALFSIFTPQIIQQIALALFFIIGNVLFCKKIIPLSQFVRSFLSSLNKKEIAAFSILTLIILSKLISSTYIRDDGTLLDATTYHLGAPKEWATYMNGAHFNLNNPVLFTSSYYEYFNYSYIVLFKQAFYYLAKLSATHYEFLLYVIAIATQMITAVWGFILIPVLIYSMFREKKILAFTAIAGFLSLKSMTWLWPLAKNNAYTVVVVLTSFYLVYLQQKKALLLSLFNLSLFVGFLWGVAVGSKFTNGYVLPFVLMTLLIHYKKEIALFSFKKISLYFALIIFGGILGMGIVLLRNTLATGNPIFPIDFLVKNPMILESFEKSHYLYSHPSTWSVVFDKMYTLYIKNPPLLIFTILSLLYRQFLFPVAFFFIALLNAKLTGVMSAWPHKAVLMVLLLPWIYDFSKRLKNQFLKYSYKIEYALVVLFLLLSPISFENFLKRPMQRYTLTAEETLKRTAYYFDKIMKDNREHYLDSCYVVNDYYGGYFSRFPFIKKDEANPNYTYDYCTKN